MYGLVDKTYIGEPTTTSSLQSQDFVNILMVMDTRRVDGVEKESLDTGQCQEECINTLSQRLCSHPLKICRKSNFEFDRL
jgi:hypothetical protein